jgi:serine phosphatase RsbU (regulator of sigma subunit)
VANVAVVKIGKYAVSESGDTVEVVERPNGGLSVVMADGQRSGRSAKVISNLVVRKAMGLLSEGVRDGAAARAAHDYLRTHRSGQVSSTLNILSLDLSTGTVVISRNNSCPAMLVRGNVVTVLDQESESVGIRSRTRPVITEIPVEPGLIAVAFTDGIEHAGRRTGSWDVAGYLQGLLDDGEQDAQRLADAILARALELDEGRPRDDMAVALLQIGVTELQDGVRRLCATVPLRSH